MSPAETGEETSSLYNRVLIDLAAAAGTSCVLPGAAFTGRAVSPICGSRVDVALTVGPDGTITGFGYEVEACVLTKSVIAVMRQAIVGATAAEVAACRQALSLLLAGDLAAAEKKVPHARWSDLLLLAPIKDYPARHNAVQLPFEAVEQALRTV